MYPAVNKYSMRALKRFCHKKNFARTKTFIDKIWDKEAIRAMMRVSSTPDLDSLVIWLTQPDLDQKLTIINNSF